MSIYDVHIYGIRISLFKPNSYDIGTIKQTPLQDLVFDADNYYRFIFYIYYRTNNSIAMYFHYLLLTKFIII